MSELPMGWVEIECGKTFDQISTTNIKVKTKDAFPEGLFPVVDQGLREIAGYVNDEEKVIPIEKPVCVFGDHTRIIKWVDYPFVPGADGTKVLNPKKYWEPRFFYYQLLSLKIVDRGYARHFKFLKAADFFIPPLNEQIRIANKLDSLLAKVETAQARLEKIPVLLKRFRQAVLAAATSGKLTREWREENLETPLRNEIQGKFQLSEEIVSTFELPKSWQWVPLGNLAICARGKFSVRPRNDPSCFGGEYPFIQIGNLPKEGGFVEKHQQTLNDKGLSVSRMFDEGTIVLAIVGATIANTGILRYSMCFPDSLIGINAATNIENIYIDYFLRSVKEDIRQSSYAGGGQPNIKLTTVNPLPIPVPPEEEVVEIVRRVETLFTLADKVETQYQAAKTRLDKLTQSILAKAFRGELVPQDPNDEPASELLKRIQAEREQQVKSKPKRGRKKAIS